MAAKKRKRSTPKKRKAPKRTASKRKPTPPQWKFSDGTVVRIGGEIEGTSAVAAAMREMLAEMPFVALCAHPGPCCDLDVNDLTLLDAWIQQHMWHLRRVDESLKLVESPENVPRLPVVDQGEPPVVPDGFQPIY